MENLYVDVHVLQTVPPSCVNRDDTGAPKSCVYGGTSRSRVSSQAWKKAVRDDFKDRFPAEDLGIRTRKVKEALIQEIMKLDSGVSHEDAEKLADKTLTACNLKTKAKDVLTFTSLRQLQKLAQYAVDGETNKKVLQAAFNSEPTMDMALFGRMVATDPVLNVDATCQVAHAISTHQVSPEFDYFTAMDDLSDEDNAGAGHLGFVEYNSSTLYRYATVNVKELCKLVGAATPTVVEAFLDAFVKSMPTGKMNTFANRTLPFAVYVTIRKDQPVSMVGAFEKAVPASAEGYEAKSAASLVKYAKNMYDNFADEPFKAYVSGEGLDQLANSMPFKKLVKAVGQEVKTLTAGDE